jgi:hypothetical protein
MTYGIIRRRETMADLLAPEISQSPANAVIAAD